MDSKTEKYAQLIRKYGVSDTGRGTLRVRASVPAETLDFIRAGKAWDTGILARSQGARKTA